MSNTKAIEAAPSIYSNKIYDFYEERSTAIWGGLESSARLIAEEIDTFLGAFRETIEFSDDTVGETLQQAWKGIRSFTVCPNDTMDQVIKKLTFAFFISIPAAFLIKNVASNAHIDLTKADSVLEFAGMLFKKYIYITGAVYALGFLALTKSSVEDRPENEDPTKTSVEDKPENEAPTKTSVEDRPENEQ